MMSLNYFMGLIQCQIFMIILSISQKSMSHYPLIRVSLNRSWFVIHNKILNFHNWILCYHEPFHNNAKYQRKISIDLNLRKYNHVKCISGEYANNYLWTLWTLNYVDSVLLFSIDLSSLKNLVLKFLKNMIIALFIYSH